MKRLPGSLALFAFQAATDNRLQANLYRRCCGLDALSSSPSLIIGSIAQHPALPELSLNVRPRAKLKTKHKHLFEKKERTGTDHRTALFDELALIACETGVVPRKELFETYTAALHIHETFSHMKRMADLAAGHGLLSWFLLVLDYEDRTHHANNSLRSTEPESSVSQQPSRPRTVVCVDRRMPPSAQIIAAAMIQKYPDLESRWTYVQSDLSSVVPHSSCLITSVHACGTLTDYLIELAIGDSNGNRSTRVPLAVVPCCHTVNARKGYRPHFLSGMEVDEVVASVEQRKNTTRQDRSKRMAISDVLDDIRFRTLENAGYDVKEVMLPEIFTARNRLILGQIKDEVLTTRVEQRTRSQLPDFDRYGKSIFKRQPSSVGTIQIPLSDDEESISQCHAISGKDRSNTRLLQKIPKHFSPYLVISIWLDNTHLKEESRNSTEFDEAVSLAVLQNFADQCSKRVKTDKILCIVEVLGDVYVQPETNRRSQRYKFTYKKPEGTDITKACVSRELAKVIDKDIRGQILAKFGDILR